MTLYVTPPRVLLIEDDLFFSEAMQRWLQRSWPETQFCACETLESTAKAIDSFRPDLVFADLRLPDSPEPRATCASLLELLSPWTPLILVSAHITMRDTIEYLAAGADACLMKRPEAGFFPRLVEAAITVWAQARGREQRITTAARYAVTYRHDLRPLAKTALAQPSWVTQSGDSFA